MIGYADYLYFEGGRDNCLRAIFWYARAEDGLKAWTGWRNAMAAEIHRQRENVAQDLSKARCS
jgi:hypothetical protein